MKAFKYLIVMSLIFIFGNIRITHADTGIDGTVMTSSSFTMTGLVSISTLTVNNMATTSSMTVSGNVGIRVTTPYKPLDIAGDIRMDNSNSMGWWNSANSGGSGTDYFALRIAKGSGAYSGSMDFYVRYAGTTDEVKGMYLQSNSEGTADLTINGNVVPQGIVGTTTNNNAAAGDVGEYISSTVVHAAAVAAPATSTFFDIASITLTAGDWDITGLVEEGGSAGATSFDVGIGTASGNNTAGLSYGDTLLETGAVGNSTADGSLTIPAVRKSLSTTTPIYLKCVVVYPSGTQRAYGRISARRVR